MLRRDHRILKNQDDAGDNGGGGGGAPADDSSPVKAERPTDLPEDFWDADKGEVKFAEIGAKLNEYKTAAEGAPKGVEKPEDIDFSLPADLDPEAKDTVFEVNRDDPLVQAITPALVGLPQEKITALVGEFAKFQIAQEKQIRTAIAAEEKKLGDKFMDRIAGVQSFIEQVAIKNGKSAADAKALALRTRQTWVTAEQVELFELLAKHAGGPQPADPNNQGGQETSDNPGRTFFSGMSGAS